MPKVEMDMQNWIGVAYGINGEKLGWFRGELEAAGMPVRILAGLSGAIVCVPEKNVVEAATILFRPAAELMNLGQDGHHIYFGEMPNDHAIFAFAQGIRNGSIQIVDEVELAPEYQAILDLFGDDIQMAHGVAGLNPTYDFERMITWFNVNDSSHVMAVGFSNPQMVPTYLFIRFHRNGIYTSTYEYSSVPAEVIKSILFEAVQSAMGIDSASVGGLVKELVKGGGYVYRKLEADEDNPNA